MPALALTLLTAFLPPQEPDEVLANYRLLGKPATVTRTDVALEMAAHLRRRDRGQAATTMLVDSLLTRREAERVGLMPTEAEARAFWERLQRDLRAEGQDPRTFPGVRNTGERDLLRFFAIQIAQQRLVRKELGLGGDDPVTGDMSRLWLDEAKKRSPVVTDPDALPAGVAARVGEAGVALIDLGLLLLRTAEDEERDKFVRQVVYLECLEARAAAERLTVTAADLDAAVAQRRREMQNDPSYRGATLENLLEAQGMTVAALRELRVFRSKILLDKLTRQLHPDAELQREIMEHRDLVLDAVGPRRRIGLIFVRALEPPNDIITRDFDAAIAHLVAVRERVVKDGFRATAAIESEHGPSKASGGDLGWYRRRSTELPEAALKAAFALEVGQVSMPVRDTDGCYLITVFDAEPPPPDAQLLPRLREHRAHELERQLLDEADIRFVGDADGTPR